MNGFVMARDHILPTTAEIIDAELRLRGESLELWANDYGLTLLGVIATLEGLGERQAEIIDDLADTLGISFAAMRALLRLSPRKES